ncbi:MAG TPA: hemolysin family protein [Gemmatimonadales bacterium]|nr:hemolysin family protein [Gemmatimonadales bacterium]
MIAMLRLFFGPLILTALTLWAAWLALAAEADADLPRSLSGQLETDVGPVALSRQLHVAHLALLVLAGAAAGATSAWWVWSPLPGFARLILAVLLVWILGDLLPRIVAAVAPDLAAPVRRAAPRTLGPFRPLLRAIAWADHRMRRPGRGVAQRDLGHAQRDMLLGVFSLADTTVSEVMTPRIDIIAVDASACRDEVVRTLQSSEHARLLVYERHPDAITGVIHAKDMLASLEDATTSWHALIRPATFVPEAKTLDHQLRDFQRGPSHIAVVVDEFGGTAGIVTLEDILEQIVGEIRDEYDTDEVAPIQELGEEQFRVQGGVALTELEAVLGHRFEREDVSTVGGLVLAEFGRVPRSGEMLERDGFQLMVEQVVRRRVKRITVRRAPLPAATGGNGA